MPSITGMRMSVNSNSKVPCSRVSTSSASAPSLAVTTSWPSSESARATRLRMASSSSAIRMRAMGSSLDTGEQVAPVEKTHHHVLRLARRGGEPGTERKRLPGREQVLSRQRGPAVDLVAARVSHRETQPRHFDDAVHRACDRAFDHQHLHTLVALCFGGGAGED